MTTELLEDRGIHLEWALARFCCAVLCVMGWLLSPAMAAACPRCAAGIEARRQVFSQGFWLPLWALTLPLVSVGMAAWVAHRIDSRPTRHEGGQHEPVT